MPKSGHVEDKEITLRDGTRRLFSIYAENGAIGIRELNERGEYDIIPLKRCRTRPVLGKGGYRWHNSFKIPRVFGGGGIVHVRMDPEESEDRGFNRVENLRIIPESDDDFGPLATLRPDAESINSDLKRSMDDLRRAHSLGRIRIQMNLIGYGLMVNSITLHLARGSAPPGALAA